MKQILFSSTRRGAVIGAFSVVLAACGGGGGGSGAGGWPMGPIGGGTPVEPSPVASSSTLSGVAATGAAFVQAAITVTDATGATVCSTTTDSGGSYRCTLPAGTKVPLVIRAARGEQVLYSAVASSADGTANVTPLTTIVVSRLAPQGHPGHLAAAIQSAPETVTADTLRVQVSALIAALQPLLRALGLSENIDPIGGVFSADGTGQDKLLDTISVSVRPDGSSANVEITVKTLPVAADSAPLSIVFRSSDVAIPALPATLTAQQLAPVPAPGVVSDLLKRLTACYVLPLSQRVNANSDAGNAIGTAADVIAPACRTLFEGDDPASYVANGREVGRNANNAGAFASLFRAGATGLQWEQGNVEFFRDGSTMILSYRWTDASGNTDTDTLAAREVGGVLKLTGNSNAYNVSVRPFAQNRELLNTPAFSSFTTGYNISIDNRTDGAGSPVFSQVKVTAPTGEQRIYLPQPGLSYLVVTRDDGVTPTATPVFRLRGEYQDAATPGNPSEKEGGIYFVSPQYTDARIAALNNQGAWTLEFVHVDSAVQNVVQHHRTLSRSLTIGEIRQSAFAEITPALRAELVAASKATGDFAFGAPSQAEPNIVDFSADGNQDGWVVPVGALAPTSFSALGRAPAGARFNDTTGVSGQARKAQLFCSPQTAADAHCDSRFGAPQYAEGSTINSFELWARSSRQVEMSRLLGLYKLQ